MDQFLFRPCLLALLVATALWGQRPALAAEEAPAQPSLHLQIFVPFDHQDRPTTLQGKLTLTLGSSHKRLCFYLPYHDERALSAYHPLKHFDHIAAKTKARQMPEGEIRITGLSPHPTHQTKPTPSRLELDLSQASSRVEMTFVTTLDEEFQSQGDDYVFEGFYPQLLQACPGPIHPEAQAQLQVAPMPITATIRTERPWQISGPGIQPQAAASPASAGQGTQEANTQHLQTWGKSLAFALARHYTHTSLTSPQGRIHLFALDPHFFARTEDTIRKALASHSRLFGPLPFSDLTIVESRHSQRADLPGMIVVNKPRQFLFNYLQKNMLNWQHWTLSALIAAQWYGATIGVEALRDQWLLAGISNFANLEFLLSYKKRFNLFNIFEKDLGLLSMDYLQVQEATASLLQRAQPESALTDLDLRSSLEFQAQSPLLFVKHSLALRYLKSLMGHDRLYAFLNALTQSHLFQTLTPQQFMAALDAFNHDLAPQKRQEITANFKQWWTAHGWSDLSLLQFTKKPLANGQWLASASFKQVGSINLASQVGFRDKKGETYIAMGQTAPEDAGLYRAYSITDLEPVEVTLDPYHYLFDSDRFDNSSREPALRFFPGSASNLSDRDYTAIWLPYAFRRPGETVSLALQAALFRYFNSGVFLKLEASPAERTGSYHLRYEHLFPQSPLSTEWSLTQTYEGKRTFAAVWERDPAFTSSWLRLLLQVTARYRLMVGQPLSRHPTLAAAAKLKPHWGHKACSLVLFGEREQTLPNGQASPIAYYRQKALSSVLCQLHKGYDLNLRYFSGQAHAYGRELPDIASFKLNDLSEAGVRIDTPLLAPAPQVDALGLDLFLPFSLPLPADSLILNKHMQLRAFYDVGRARQLGQGLVYRAAGLGFTLPLGGDVMGVGTLTLSRFSLLTVLYSSIAGKPSRRPHVLFDVTGEL